MASFNLNDYIDVQTRINRFWTENPDGAIRTQHASDPHDFEVCRYRAEVYKHRDSTAPDAVGYAFERAGAGMANKTSHEENCETSAIGRALANMGYATSGKDRPSQEEMNKALANSTPASQSAPEPNGAPAQVQSHQPAQNAPQGGAQRTAPNRQFAPAQPGTGGPATDGQKRALWGISNASKETIDQWASEYGESNGNLTKGTASVLIDKYGGN